MADNKDAENHQQCTNRFIELANAMVGEGLAQELVSAALMTSSGLFATYIVAGNEGGLNPSGIDRVTDAYRNQLDHIQKVKEKQFAKE